MNKNENKNENSDAQGPEFRCGRCGGAHLQARIGWVDLNTGELVSDGPVDWEAVTDSGFMAWCSDCGRDVQTAEVCDA